jgi:ribosomal protein S18 acetylase RimI-like enzyme
LVSIFHRLNYRLKFIPTSTSLSKTLLGESTKLDNWYLTTFGVTPEYRGLGIGRTLVCRVEQEAFPNNKLVCLETSHDKNVCVENE